MNFLIKFCGNKTLAVLFMTSMLTLILDLLSIALIFPFLKLFISPEIILSNARIQPVYRYLNFTSTNQFIMAIGIGLAVLYLVKLFLKTYLTKIKFDMENSITFKLATDLFKGLLGARYSLFTEGSASEMVGIINAHTVHSVICLESWIIIVNEASFLAVLIIAFVLLSPGVTLTVLAAFSLMGIVLYIGLVKRIDTYGQVHSRLNLLVYKFAFDVANSIKDIKIMGLENNYVGKFTKIWKEYSENASKAKTAKGIPKDFSETLVFGGIVFMCLYLLATKQHIVDMIPLLGVVAVSAMRILPSFNRIIMGYSEYKYFKNSLVVVEDLHSKLTKNKQFIKHVPMAFDKTFRIHDVRIRYADKTVLDSVSLTIEKGTSVAFVGLSGAGKSTLLDVLAGLKQVECGEFYLDGKVFDPFSMDSLRARIGYVPQHVSLIDDSLAYNISFEENHDSDKIDKVVKMARLSPYIEGLERGVDTLIGESGVRVSGGQRQRIGIARALYRDPEILIFDEATSALDNVTERELMIEINALSGSKTLIIVAHRLSTVENCDTIYLLDQGRIISQGTHKELLTLSAEYRNLYNQQQQT